MAALIASKSRGHSAHGAHPFQETLGSGALLDHRAALSPRTPTQDAQNTSFLSPAARKWLQTASFAFTIALLGPQFCTKTQGAFCSLWTAKSESTCPRLCGSPPKHPAVACASLFLDSRGLDFHFRPGNTARVPKACRPGLCAGL